MRYREPRVKTCSPRGRGVGAGTARRQVSLDACAGLPAPASPRYTGVASSGGPEAQALAAAAEAAVGYLEDRATRLAAG
jgi:hypothetical protein